jgi:hypothetical protein
MLSIMFNRTDIDPFHETLQVCHLHALMPDFHLAMANDLKLSRVGFIASAPDAVLFFFVNAVLWGYGQKARRLCLPTNVKMFTMRAPWDLAA